LPPAPRRPREIRRAEWMGAERQRIKKTKKRIERARQGRARAANGGGKSLATPYGHSLKRR